MRTIKIKFETWFSTGWGSYNQALHEKHGIITMRQLSHLGKPFGNKSSAWVSHLVKGKAPRTAAQQLTWKFVFSNTLITAVYVAIPVWILAAGGRGSGPAVVFVVLAEEL